VRNKFRGLIGDGLTPEQASQQVLSSYPTPEEDPEIGSVVVIALALAKWKIGRLIDPVKTQAVQQPEASYLLKNCWLRAWGSFLV
jgi:hypothetical protein